MAYNAIRQSDSSPVAQEHEADHVTNLSASGAPPQLPASPFESFSLNLEHDANSQHRNAATGTFKFNSVVQSIRSKRTRDSTSYDVVEDDDYTADSPTSIPSPLEASIRPEPLNIPHPLPRLPKASASTLSTSSNREPSPEPLVRTASGHSVALRHPTPDLQTLQGAYSGNVEHLEKTAEKLSMTSSIEHAIRDLHMEQKRSDSWRSSLLSSHELPTVSRQVSHASSIVEVNNTARSGGYSPAAFMVSPGSSFTKNTRGRSTSKSSRFGSRPEPELEGRTLDSFVNSSSMLSRSIAEQDEEATTLTRPIAVNIETKNAQPVDADESRPTTSASVNTFEQAQRMFADFDGVHSSDHRILETDSQDAGNEEQPRAMHFDEPDFDDPPLLQRTMSARFGSLLRSLSPRNRHSMPRPQSYADPETGQEMVYYPAPVPAMLNLPQKLSKLPSSMARKNRRSQVLSTIPAPARQSAIWLPDVLETEDCPYVPEEDEAQNLEYVPQHQRMSMGGRRLTQDIQHLPPQLRASAFFDLPAAQSDVVEIKDKSAVATLDSILDAAAHAPVSAFTDHAIAGHLGAEVYGKPSNQARRNSTQALVPETSNKRMSTFSLLRGRPTSIMDPEDKRRSTMSNILDFRKSRSVIEHDEDDIKDTTPLQQIEPEDGKIDGLDEDEGQRDGELYHGPPTTLLAELQLRKQQQKARTRPLTTVYPNGVHSTLLEMDAVAQLEQKTRKEKRINLAWEDAAGNAESDDDENVPLGILFAQKAQNQDRNRPLGLMERRDMEDNEPLSRRKDRLYGGPPQANRSSTLLDLEAAVPEDENETLAQRIHRPKEQKSASALPHARSVSGDFASEMMSQFGGEVSKPSDSNKEQRKNLNVSPGPDEEEETLGQRRLRLKAEREARAIEMGNGMRTTSGDMNTAAKERPALQTRCSMADILQVHPAANSNRVFSGGAASKQPTGLLSMHEKQKLQRASTVQTLTAQHLQQGRTPSGGQQQSSSGLYANQQVNGGGSLGNNMTMNMGNYVPQFAQPTMAYQNGNGYARNQMGSMYDPYNQPMSMNINYATGGGMQGHNNLMIQNPMAASMMSMGMGMNIGMEPLTQGQLDRVERWRQSVFN